MSQFPPKQPGQGHDPKQGMAIVLAVVAVFFGAPELYFHTLSYVLAFAESRYGADWAGLAVIGWGFIVAAFIFYAARITLEIALVSAVMSVAMRIF